MRFNDDSDQIEIYLLQQNILSVWRFMLKSTML